MDAIQYFDIDTIRPSPFQHRSAMGLEALMELTASITSTGLQQPPVVRLLEDGTPELVFGHRRIEAIRRTGIAALQVVPCLVRQYSDQQVIEAQLVENLQREAVSTLDEIAAIAQLAQQGHSAAEIAHRIGRSERFVGQRLRLSQADGSVWELLRSDPPAVTLRGALEITHMPLRAQALAAAAVAREARRHHGKPLGPWYVARCLEEMVRDIRAAPFDPADAKLPGGPCGTCEHNTANHGDLFAVTEDAPNEDIGLSGHCTSPDCWSRKLASTATKLAAKGAEVRNAEDLTPRELDRMWTTADQVHGQGASLRRGLQKADIVLLDLDRGTLKGFTRRAQRPGDSDAAAQARAAKDARRRVDGARVAIVRDILAGGRRAPQPEELVSHLVERLSTWISSDTARVVCKDMGIELREHQSYAGKDFRGSIVAAFEALPDQPARLAFAAALTASLVMPHSASGNQGATADQERTERLAAMGIDWQAELDRRAAAAAAAT